LGSVDIVILTLVASAEFEFLKDGILRVFVEGGRLPPGVEGLLFLRGG
jgi:hypothetical protein